MLGDKYCVSFVPGCPWTTGYHILNAFSKLGIDYEFALPEAAASIKADKYLFIDSGHVIPINTPKDKTAIYSIDCYQNELELYKVWDTRLSWWEDICGKVSIVFEAFEFGYRWFRRRNVKVVYISMGINEDLYYKDDKDKEYDVCFVGGRKTSGMRGKILDFVGSKFNLHSPTTYGDGLRDAASKSKCFLDIPPMEDDMLGQRFFEGYACGTPMVSMERPTLSYFLKKDSGIFIYNTYDLYNSLEEAIIEATTYTKSLKRDVDHLTWTSKVKTMLKYF
tara:strand:+ start:7396 stop:8229 length:834 start_codon:yes stop_codon:yes gene_type:complete